MIGLGPTVWRDGGAAPPPSGPTMVRAAQVGAVSNLMADDLFLYFLDVGNNVQKLEIATLLETNLAAGVVAPSGIMQLAAANIFWGAADDNVYGVSTAGGGAAIVRPDFGSTLILGFRPETSTVLYVRNGLKLPLPSPPAASSVFFPINNFGGMALDATNLYWAETATGNLQQVAKGGGAVTTLVAGAAPTPFWIVSDNAHAFWATHGPLGAPFSINSVPVGGGANVVLNHDETQWQILIDATHVYYRNQSTDSISRVPKAGGATDVFLAVGGPALVWPGSGSTWLVVNSTAVFWINNDNSIWTLAK